MATWQLPTFPLGVVLFPGTTMPLHIFEPRYRQLLADIRAGDNRFALLVSEQGVAERALPPGRLGCVAELTDVAMLPDGRANIVVRGIERVALQQFEDDAAPYHVARFVTVPDVGGESPVALAVIADECAANFRRVVQAVHALADNAAPPPPLPDDAAQLAWAIAAMTDLDLSQRYTLLGEQRPGERIRQVDAVLRRALPDLELRAAMHRA